MGYCAETVDTAFTIPADRTKEALLALREEFGSECPALFDDKQITLADAIEELSGFQECVQSGPGADFHLGYHCDKYLMGTDELLGILGRYATEGSYVRFLGEDRCLFGFRVSGGHLRTEHGNFTWTLDSQQASSAAEHADGSEEYRVGWTIDVAADSPQSAALAALTIQRDANSIATVFDVRRHTRDTAGRAVLGEQMRVDVAEL